MTVSLGETRLTGLLQSVLDRLLEITLKFYKRRLTLSGAYHEYIFSNLIVRVERQCRHRAKYQDDR